MEKDFTGTNSWTNSQQLGTMSSGRNGLVSHISKADLSREEEILVKTVINIIDNKQHTQYDLQKVIRKLQNKSNLIFKLEVNGLNILQAILDKGRLIFLQVILNHGWWNILSSQKVPEDSPSDHKGRTAKQIAESKRTRKPLDEFIAHQEWELSLSPLMKACRSGDILKARQIMDTGGIEIFHLDNHHGSALYWAVVGGSLELFHALVDMGLDVNMKTKKKESLLHVACTLGQSHMVSDLVQKYKIDPWHQDVSHKSCHDRIAENGDIETLKELIKCEVQPKSNVASLAAFAGRSPYLVYLLDVLHLPVDSSDIYNRTALHRSLEGGHYGISKFLVDKGADVTVETKMGRNILHIVAEEGNVKTMRWIITVLKSLNYLDQLLNKQDRYNGVDLCFLIRGRDKGRDAFHYVEVERWKVPIFLKKTRAGNVDVAIYGRVIKSDWGVNPDQDTVVEIEEIFKHRRLSQSAPQDQTPLHVAMVKSNFEVAKVLIEEGADIHVKDKFGQTPVFYAVSRGSLEMLTLLEKKGADFNVDFAGKTLKDIAEENELTDVLNYRSGRNSFDLVENFRVGPLQRLNNNICSEQLNRERQQGKNIKQYLTQSLREITSEINQLLLKLDSGPVVECTDDTSNCPGFERFQPPGRLPYDSGIGSSILGPGQSTNMLYN